MHIDSLPLQFASPSIILHFRNDEPYRVKPGRHFIPHIDSRLFEQYPPMIKPFLG